MRKQFFFITLLLFLNSCLSSEKKKPQGIEVMNDDFTIAFYNVENFFDTKDDPGIDDEDFTPDGEKHWDKEKYQKKLDNIAKVFLAIDDALPLVIGLCEVENKGVLEDLVEHEKLRSANYGIVHYNSPDTRGIDVCLLYKKNYLLVEEEISIPVEFDNRPEVLTRDILYVKAILNEEIVHFYVNHWSSKGKGEKETEWKRIETAKILHEDVSRVLKNDPSAKIIIMGDFNAEPHNVSLLKHLEAGPPSDSPFLYNTSYNLSAKGVGSHYYNGWNMLDQMIVSKSLYLSKKGISLESKNQQILDEDWLYYETHQGKFPNKTYSGNKYYGGFSDHLPIYLTLESN